MSWILLFAGFVLLVLGGDWLVRGASNLALRLGISPLVIGLTVVAFGTSAPELAATIASSLQGAPDLGIGNVLGSNVANVGLILGASAALAPIATNTSFLQRDVPLAIGTMLLLVPLTLDGRLGRIDGLILLAILAAYLTYLVRFDPDAINEEVPESPGERPPLAPAIGRVLVGLAFLVLGADLVVRGGVEIAAQLGVPERIVGLTLVAFGTSLPELATSIAAAARRQGDMILGNIAGSNLFNVLAVLGVTASGTTLPVRLGDVTIDLLVAVGFSAFLLPVMAARGNLGRTAGVVLLTGYLTYMILLFVT